MCLHYVGRIWSSLRCTQQKRPCWRYTFAGSAPTVLFWVIMSLYVISFRRVFFARCSHRIHVCYIWWHLPSIYPNTIHGSYRVCDFIRLSPVEIHALTVRKHQVYRPTKQITAWVQSWREANYGELHATFETGWYWKSWTTLWQVWIDVVCWFGSKWCPFYNCSLFYIYILYQKKSQTMFIPFFDDKWQMIANHHICRQITICVDWIANFGSWKKQVDWIANCGSWNEKKSSLFNQFLHCKLTVKLHWTALNPILMVNFWLTVFLDTLQTSPKQTVTSELCQPKGKLHDAPWNPNKNPVESALFLMVKNDEKTPCLLINRTSHHLYSYGHLLVITGYKWDYTFYKWGYKYL